MKWQLSSKAEKDLYDIFSYTIDKWGYEQSQIYITTLEKAIIRLAQDPDIGREIHPEITHALKWKVEHHFIVYQATTQGLFILRILHEKMDFKRHL